MVGMGAEQVGSVVLGLALLAVAWACWSGRWKAWSRIAVLPSAPIALAPGVGLCFVLSGFGAALPQGAHDLLFVAALAAAAAGCLLAFWDPSWYGPKWYRHRDRALDLSVPINAAVASAAGHMDPQASSEATAKAMFSNQEPAARWRAHLVSDAWGRPSAMQRMGMVRGHVLVYPEALVFAADGGEDRMRGRPVVQVIPAASIVDAKRVPPGTRAGPNVPTGPELPSRVVPRVSVQTHRAPVVFETALATRRAGEINRRYVDRSPESRAARLSPLDDGR